MTASFHILSNSLLNTSYNFDSKQLEMELLEESDQFHNWATSLPGKQLTAPLYRRSHEPKHHSGGGGSEKIPNTPPMIYILIIQDRESL
jgi:hypothetical protein